MITLFVDTEEFGRVAVIHHSDWSGNAVIVWEDRRVIIPAQLLVEISKEAAIDAVKSAVIESLEDL